jgi:hypothetical protein
MLLWSVPKHPDISFLHPSDTVVWPGYLLPWSWIWNHQDQSVSLIAELGGLPGQVVNIK